MHRRALVLAIIGVTFGTWFDWLHVRTGAIAYPSTSWLGVPAWVPLLYACTAMIVGLAHPRMDRALRRPIRVPLTPLRIAAGFAGFCAIWFATGALPVSSGVALALLGPASIALWAALDRTWQGALLAVATAVSGVAFEVALTSAGLFRHTHPDVFGVAMWLPSIYIAASIGVGNLGRALDSGYSFGFIAIDNFYRRIDCVDSRYDVPYGSHSKQKLDLFLPRGAREGLPVVVFVHGGYWSAQDKRFLRGLSGLYSNAGVALADRGIAAAVIGYRQYPIAKTVDDSLADIASSVRFIRDQAAAYGVDPRKIVLAGHSAGGHLAALLAVEMCESGDAPPIAGFVSLAGAYDVARLVSGLGLSHSRAAIMRTLLGEDDEKLAPRSPERRLHSGLAPSLLVIGERETAVLRREHEAMKEALAREGAPSESFEVPGVGHMGLVLRMGRTEDGVTDKIAAFVHRVTTVGE